MFYHTKIKPFISINIVGKVKEIFVTHSWIVTFSDKNFKVWNRETFKVVSTIDKDKKKG